MTDSGEGVKRPMLKGLVVDDDAEWASRFTRYLREAQLTAVRATSLHEAAALLDREFFHVALVDMSLVGDENRDGLKVLGKVYTELKEGTEAILLTAFGGVEEGKQAGTLGAFEVFSKGRPGGLDGQQVVKVIRAAADKASKTLAKSDLGLSIFGGSGVTEQVDFLSSKIIFTLKNGYNSVDATIAALLQDCRPLLLQKNQSGMLFDEHSHSIFVDLWSKMLGKRIGMFITSNRQAFEEELRTFEMNRGSYREGRFQDVLGKVENGRKGSLDLLFAILFGGQPTEFELFHRATRSGA